AGDVVGRQAGRRRCHRCQRGPGVLRPPQEGGPVDPARERAGPAGADAGAGQRRGCGGDGERRGEAARDHRPPAEGGMPWVEVLGHVLLLGVDHFRPVVAMPWMKRFWKTRKTMRTGTTTMVAPAMSRPYCVWFWPVETRASATGRV